MAKCGYSFNGVTSPELDASLNYIEDSDPGTRSPAEFMEKLADAGIFVFDENVGSYVTLRDEAGKDAEKVIDAINQMTVDHFRGGKPLLLTSPLGNLTRVQIDNEVLNKMVILPEDITIKDENESNRTPKNDPTEEEAPQEGRSALEEEAADQREDVDLVTARIVANLQYEINRIGRLPDTEKTSKQKADLKVLQRNMDKVKKTHQKVSDYFDFIDYVAQIAKRGSATLSRISDELNVNPEDMTDARKSELLNDISQLKESIDAFYSQDSKKSLLALLETKLLREGVSGTAQERGFLLEKLQATIAEMREIDNIYLDKAIPVLARTLTSLAPIQINVELDAQIDNLKENAAKGIYKTSGLSRLDKRFLTARAKGRAAVTQLNIQQLEEKKIGVKEIENELRETHNKVGWFSMWADPAIYSSDTIVKTVAMAVRDKYIRANDESIAFKYMLRDEFKRFRQWKGVSEDRPDLLYADLYEKVFRPIFNPETKKIELKEVIQFVSDRNISKFYKDREKAWEGFRKTYNYPENPSELDAYFDGVEGKAYLEATAQWWYENSEPDEEAVEIERELQRRRAALFTAINKTTSPTERQALSVEINEITSVLRNSVRRYQGRKIYIGKLAKPDRAKYKNPKYENMPAEAKRYMDILLEAYSTAQKSLGSNPLPKAQFEETSLAFPGVRKSAYDAYFEKGFKNSAGNMLGDTFTAQETDTEFGELRKANGEPLKMIPQYYVNYVEPALVSKDITNSIIKFVDMANRYKAKSELLGLVNLTRAALESRDQLEMTASGDYALDRIAKQARVDLVQRGKSSDNKALQQFDSFIDNMFYGISMVRKDDILQRITGKLDSNKLASFAGTMTAVTALSFNFIQAGNQIILDSTMNASEGWAGQYYSRKDLFKARGITMRAGFGLGALANVAENAAPKFATDNKLIAFMEWADAMQEFGDNFGNQAGTAVKKLMGLNSMFLAQHAAEFQTTSERLVAMAMATEGKIKDKSGKVILNKNGKPANLWDLFEKTKTGQFKLDPRVATVDGKAWNKSAFIGRLHGLNKRTNQLKGNMDKPMVNRYAMGRMLALFRNYFVPGYRKRWGYGGGGIHTDIESGQITEGYYQTAFNLLSNAWHNKGEIRSVYAGMSQMEKQNMSRFMHEQLFIWGLAALGSILGGMLDDDDMDSYLVDFMAYQALRLNTEMRAYLNPLEFARIISSPTAVATPVKNWWQFFGSVKNLGLYQIGLADQEDVFYQRRSGRFEKGDLKFVKELYDVMPGIAGSFKSLDPAEAAKWYQLE